MSNSDNVKLEKEIQFILTHIADKNFYNPKDNKIRKIIEEKSEKNSLRHVVLIVNPEHLRIDTLAQNSAYPLSLLIAKGGEVVFVDPIEKMALLSKAAWALSLERHAGLSPTSSPPRKS